MKPKITNDWFCKENELLEILQFNYDYYLTVNHFISYKENELRGYLVAKFVNIKLKP